MEKKDKSRGLKHIRDKRKYRDNTTKNPKHVPPKQLPKLDSNWDRYDELEDDLIDSGPGTDFSTLANAPITRGNHFQLKKDKIVVEETKQDLFTFDLGTLHDSIVTIPFYKRMQMDEKYFSEAQLKSMRKEAEENLERYNKKYRKYSDSEQGEVQEIYNMIQEIQLDKGNPINEGTNKDKLDVATEPNQMTNISTMKEEIVSNTQEGNNRTSKDALNENLSEEDLDKWLDDVLAD